LNADKIDTDVVDIEINANQESCVLYFYSTGEIEKNNCLSMTNSKGVKIYCTPGKKVCKTYDEAYKLVFPLR